MGREEQLLALSIGESFLEAHRCVDRIAYISEGFATVAEAERENPPLEEAEDTLRWYVERIYRDVALLAERMVAPQTAGRILAELETIQKGDLASVQPTPYDVGLSSSHLSRAHGHFNPLMVMTQGTEVSGLEIFRNILENTPAIVALRTLDPKKEADVQRAVYEVLKIAFPDAIREHSISQLMKNYKPDLCVRSLMAAAEYKFAETEAEVLHTLDGIYTDMKGYAGHYEWRTFFAVIYTTDTIVNPKRLQAEFRGVRAGTNWTPIVVVGKGQRKARASRRSSPRKN